MKVAFISTTAGIILMMRCITPYKITYIRENDSVDYFKFLIPPCIILALMINEEFELVEVLWSFSIFLEAVAYVP